MFCLFFSYSHIKWCCAINGRHRRSKKNNTHKTNSITLWFCQVLKCIWRSPCEWNSFISIWTTSCNFFKYFIWYFVTFFPEIKIWAKRTFSVVVAICCYCFVLYVSGSSMFPSNFHKTVYISINVYVYVCVSFTACINFTLLLRFMMLLCFNNPKSRAKNANCFTAIFRRGGGGLEIRMRKWLGGK